MAQLTYGFGEVLNAIKRGGMAHRDDSPVLLKSDRGVPGTVLDVDTGKAWVPTNSDIMAVDWVVMG